METIIIIITIIIFILALFLVSAIMHIRAIQKELADLNEVYSEQDRLLNIIVEHNKNLTAAVKDIQDCLYEQPTTIYPFDRIMGEA